VQLHCCFGFNEIHRHHSPRWAFGTLILKITLLASDVPPIQLQSKLRAREVLHENMRIPTQLLARVVVVINIYYRKEPSVCVCPNTVGEVHCEDSMCRNVNV